MLLAPPAHHVSLIVGKHRRTPNGVTFCENNRPELCKGVSPEGQRKAGGPFQIEGD